MFIPSGRGIYTCPLCPSACTHFREMKTHFAKQQPIWEMKVKCRPCGFTGEFHSVRCHKPKCKGSADRGVSTDQKFSCRSVPSHSKPSTALVNKNDMLILWLVTNAGVGAQGQRPPKRPVAKERITSGQTKMFASWQSYN